MRIADGAKSAIFLVKWTIVFFFLCALSPASAENSPVLEISSVDGAKLFSRELLPGQGFAIRYTHSVALSPVIDYFLIEDGKIFIDSTVYEDFGAGLPHEALGDQKMTAENGKIVLTGLKRVVDPFELRVGRIANHTLIVGDDEIPLTSVAKPGQTLVFKIKN